MRIPIALSLLLSTSVLLPAQPVPELEFFPPPAEGLTIPAYEPDGWNIEQLLSEYGRLTDQQFMYGEATRAQLRQARVPLDAGLFVEPENVHSVVETLMVESNFVFTVAREANPRLISVQSMHGSRVNMRQRARYVAVDELAQWEDHPAILVHTVLTLNHTDVRTLTNSMRAMLTDANTQQIIPVGNSHSLILTGFGPHVASIARMLQQVDDATRELHEAQPKAAEQAR